MELATWAKEEDEKEVVCVSQLDVSQSVSYTDTSNDRALNDGACDIGSSPTGIDRELSSETVYSRVRLHRPTSYSTRCL